MMKIQEKQNPEKLRDQLEIRHPQLPDRMMNLHIDDAQNVKVKAASMRQNIDPLMENDEKENIHTLNMDQIEHMMHEEDLTWELEKAMEWNDDYTIHIGATQEITTSEDEDMEETAMLMDLECGELKSFWSKKP